MWGITFITEIAVISIGGMERKEKVSNITTISTDVGISLTTRNMKTAFGTRERYNGQRFVFCILIELQLYV